MSDTKTNAVSKVRLNLELTTAVKEQLEGLQRTSNATSLTEVIRRALALYDLVTEHTSQGGDIILRNRDKTEERLRLL